MKCKSLLGVYWLYFYLCPDNELSYFGFFFSLIEKEGFFK